MELSRKLNLVVPVDVSDGVTAYVHSTPISREVFESYYQVIARTFNGIYQGGYGTLAGPRVAKFELRRIATEMALWDGPSGVNNGLIGEIHRLTNVIRPGNRGWTTVPFEDVIRTQYFDEDDISEIENAICFFYCSLSHAPEGGAGAHTRCRLETVGCANRVIQLYGVQRWLIDVDCNREYWREADTLVHTILDWASNEGLREVFESFDADLKFSSPHEYRSRFLIQALKSQRR